MFTICFVTSLVLRRSFVHLTRRLLHSAIDPPRTLKTGQSSTLLLAMIRRFVYYQRPNANVHLPGHCMFSGARFPLRSSQRHDNTQHRVHMISLYKHTNTIKVQQSTLLLAESGLQRRNSTHPYCIRFRENDLLK